MAALAISGFMLSTVGALVTIGGYVSPLSGSAFHMLIGVALILSGMLVARCHRAGAWICVAVFAGTVSWSLRDPGSSSLLFRLVGPASLLAVLALLMPVLCRCRPRQAVMAFVLAMVGVAALGDAAVAPPAGTTGTQFLESGTDGVTQ
jgi:quinate dehydrogenase (quinone)